jgi:DNA-binding NtrC family response regulator
MKSGNILIADDNKGILDSLSYSLKHEFENIFTTQNTDGIIKIIQDEKIDLVLLDMNFSAGISDGAEGLSWLKKIKEIDSTLPIVLITAYGDVDLAVKVIKEGATDFVLKPWDTNKLVATLKAAYKLRLSSLEIKNLRHKQNHLQENINREYPAFIGNSDAVRKIMATVNKVAKTDASVLILGENGTGKELVAHEIHKRSDRRNEVFIKVDVASLTESLFESELFGHVKGAFTDAREDRIGRFETASGGTLLLDEIGNLSISLQAKLLAAIQNREIFRIGSNKSIPIDIRLICATNKPIEKMTEENLFREDLLYRINTIQIEIPPLRERGEDIIQLADQFLKGLSQKYEKPFIKITGRAYDLLMEYDWPGNVRELKHTIEKAVILSESDTLKPEDFFLSYKDRIPDENADSLNLMQVEKETIKKSLIKNNGNMTRAANDLGITRATLYSKIAKYGL